MTSTPRPRFDQWLLAQTDREDPVGDIAREFSEDRSVGCAGDIRTPEPRIFLGVSNTNTHAARTRTGTHEGHQRVGLGESPSQCARRSAEPRAPVQENSGHAVRAM